MEQEEKVTDDKENSIIAAVEELTKETLLSKEDIYQILEESILQAYKPENKAEEDKRHNNAEDADEESEKMSVEIDRETGEIIIWVPKMVVVESFDPATEISLEDAQKDDPDYELGDIYLANETPNSFEALGRKVATKCKNILVQKLTDKTRELVCREYDKKVGQVVTCVVQKIDNAEVYDKKLDKIVKRRRIYVRVGGTKDDIGESIEGVIEEKDQISKEDYRVNASYKVYVTEIRDKKKKTGGSSIMKDPILVLSRTNSALIQKLLEQEVPEIKDGTVEIMGISRRPGERAKVAVRSNVPNVDAISACIGEKGDRINHVCDLLCGERIDIIKWSPDLYELIRNSLSPAKISANCKMEESVDSQNKRVVSLYIPNDQLTLAIGNKGINVTLAAMLCKCKIDINPDSEDTNVENNRRNLRDSLFN